MIVCRARQDLHKRLEARISAFHGTQDTILFPSCFDANAGLFEALLGPEDAVLSDELNHASIIDGIRLCKVLKQLSGPDGPDTQLKGAGTYFACHMVQLGVSRTL